MSYSEHLGAAIDRLYAVLVDGEGRPLEQSSVFALVCGPRDDSGVYVAPGWQQVHPGAHPPWQERLVRTLGEELGSSNPTVAWSSINEREVVAVGFASEDPCGLTLDQIELLRHLEPHLLRATQLRQRLVQREHILDDVCDGVLFADAEGRITFANHSARQMIESDHSSFSIEDGFLCIPKNGAAQQELRDAIAKTAESWDHEEQVLDVPLPTHERAGCPYRVRIKPMSKASNGSPLCKDGCAAIFITDPTRELGRSESWLRQSFQLTRTEARVATMLADGHSVDTCALHLSVRPNTVKSHLKSIFSKMQLHRQSELVRLIVLGDGSLNGSSRKEHGPNGTSRPGANGSSRPGGNGISKGLEFDHA